MVADSTALRLVKLWRARWLALLEPSLSCKGVGHLSSRLATWQRRWQPVLVETRGPGAHFANVNYWNTFFGSAVASPPVEVQANSTEWVTAQLDCNLIAETVLKAAALMHVRSGQASKESESVPDGLNVLHLGCGTSRLGFALAALGCDVTETDASDKAIEALMAKTAASASLNDGKGVGNLRWKVCDATALPQEWSSSFDLIVEKGLLDSLQFGGVGMLAETLREVARVGQERDGMAFVSLSDELVAPMRLELLQLCLGDGWVFHHAPLSELLSRASAGQQTEVRSPSSGCQVYVAVRVKGMKYPVSAPESLQDSFLNTVVRRLNLNPDFGGVRRDRLRLLVVMSVLAAWSCILHSSRDSSTNIKDAT